MRPVTVLIEQPTSGKKHVICYVPFTEIERYREAWRDAGFRSAFLTSDRVMIYGPLPAWLNLTEPAITSGMIGHILLSLGSNVKGKLDAAR